MNVGSGARSPSAILLASGGGGRDRGTFAVLTGSRAPLPASEFVQEIATASDAWALADSDSGTPHCPSSLPAASKIRTTK